ncbi:MAG: hypothetical protein IJS08_10725, partial [Victivallales bacterium]|nr:hypothetical protein [Victivallales bacterium]
QNSRAISSTGNLAVTATDMGVETLEMCETVQISNGLICNARFRNERTGEVLKMPILKHIEPCDALATMRSDCDGYDTSHYDYRPMVQKLGLLEKDYDKLSSADGPIVRVADDLLIPNAGFFIPGGRLIPLYDSHNQLIEYDVAYDDGQVYAMKIFKFIASPGIFWLPFRREKPGLWLPERREKHLIMDTDIKTVWANRGMAWFNDAGDLMEMDWDVIHDRDAIVWHNKQNQIEANARLRHVLNIVAIAKDKGKVLDVIKATCSSGNKDMVFNAERLRLADIRLEAHRRHLELPKPLRESAFTINLNAGAMIDTSRIRPYWERGPVTCFYSNDGFKRELILARIVRDVSGGSGNVSIMILIPRHERLHVENALGEYSGRNITCADVEILKDISELGKIVREQHIDLLLIMFDSVDEESNSTSKPAKSKTAIPQELSVQISRELLLPVGLLLPSAPNAASAYLYDRVYFAMQEDPNGKLVFVDKPDKAKKQSAQTAGIHYNSPIVRRGYEDLL